MSFNFKQYKLAQQRGRHPSELLPDEDERAFRARQNPYRLDEVPGDGQGQKLTTPGSEGMLSDAPDAGAAWGGGKEREGYPRGISQFEDQDQKFDDIPTDRDPDDPFTGNESRSEYGQGQGTDYGQALHDDANVNAGDSALGLHNTVLNDISGNDRDRKTDISNMQGAKDSFLSRRTRKPFNSSLQRGGPMDVVRDVQRKQRSS